MSVLSAPSRALRILDFDIENRPLSYWVPDNPTAEITAIASCWADDMNSMEVLLLGEVDGAEMLRRFVDRYNEADIVTGHYIRKHDLPILNGSLMEFGLPLLGPKMSCDTRLDMMKKADLPATQEFLIETLGVPVPKVHMTQADWREANRLTPEGLRKTKARVAGDVLGHMLLRLAMVERGMLRAPSVWRPGGGVAVDSARHAR